MPLLLALLGASLGSFILTVVDRIAAGTSWALTRSRCERCRRTLRAWELVPVVSWLVLRGRCHSCGVAISKWHLGLEVALGALFVAAYWLPPELGPSSLALRLALLTLGIGLFASDVRYGTVPDWLSVPAIGLALLGQGLDGHLVGALLAAAVGGAAFALQFVISRGRWVGAGDIRLGALVGALLGWPYILLGLLVTYVGGALVALVLLALRRVGLKDALPMGAFLLPAGLVVQWFGASLIAWIFP